MKTRLLTAIALIVALPAVAQANSFAEKQAFAALHQPLNTQVVSDYQTLPTRYSVRAGAADLVGQGQSVAAAQALQNVNASGQGNVDVSFASLD